MIRSGRQVLRHLSLFFVVLSTASCSERALSLFFDIPPPTAEEMAAKAVAEANAKEIAENALRAARAAAKAESQVGDAQVDMTNSVIAPVNEERPEIEKAATWDQAKKYFPMDREGRKGRPDWTEAVRRGIIKPRGSVEGRPMPPHQVFAYDFFIAAPEGDPGYEAYFPHSTHTEWIACESCHPKIFPVRGEKITKKQIKKGKFCGTCHTKKGGTAFWLRACDRCHLLAQD